MEKMKPWKKAINIGVYLYPLEQGKTFLSIKEMVAKERKRVIELAKLTVKKISMDKINMDKNHKQVVLRADIHMAIQHRNKCSVWLEVK